MSQKLEKLLDQLVKLHPKFIDLSLNRLSLLLDKLGNPHLKLPATIHIAGTNGKGSILSYIRNILQENKYLVHCYISPHLKSIEERYIVSNNQIGKQQLLNTLRYIKKINAYNPITFFEITTAAAFYIFEKEKADFVILETGLGGRLDATNIIKKSMIDIITPISVDHQEFLGSTIKKITNEKLKIIKPSSKVIISKQNNIVKKEIKKRIKKLKNIKLFFGEKFKLTKINKKSFCLNYKSKDFHFTKPSLRGRHQIENATTAIMAILQIKEMGNKISKKSIDNGLKKTIWPGRLEKGYLENIPVYLDGAHNVSGSKEIVNYFKNNIINRWLIIGMLNNKDLVKYLLIIKKIISGVIAVKIPGEKNSFSTDQISKVCKTFNIECVEQKNIKEANSLLINNIKPQEIIISGSLYLVGKIRKLYI
jgi:dihydrofolate synthase/folylpolyglutamate synthase|tara:strand:- start:2452 stop:3717 length:1266 start_codon:yes stop_codon:yes gene_type:complete